MSLVSRELRCWDDNTDTEVRSMDAAGASNHRRRLYQLLVATLQKVSERLMHQKVILTYDDLEWLVQVAQKVRSAEAIPSQLRSFQPAR